LGILAERKVWGGLQTNGEKKETRGLQNSIQSKVEVVEEHAGVFVVCSKWRA
jgi:hypothetical protein